MSEPIKLRERAVRCREIGREYHPSVGAPLFEMAREFERQAAHMELQGVDRRKPALFK
jgi:hypothetical protein